MLLAVDGNRVAELVAIDQADRVIVLDPPRECVVSCAGWWRLEVSGEAGCVDETYFLCPAPQKGPGCRALTRELAAWATLTVLWANFAPPPQG